MWYKTLPQVPRYMHCKNLRSNWVSYEVRPLCTAVSALSFEYFDGFHTGDFSCRVIWGMLSAQSCQGSPRITGENGAGESCNCIRHQLGRASECFRFHTASVCISEATLRGQHQPLSILELLPRPTVISSSQSPSGLQGISFHSTSTA